ncbi:MAG: HlyD family efflux transporter periplasmic adaptor subunit [Clostridium sp.]|nr:HlyD family efflux transporter periplasmic adaptor subunit [Acetatifactor muris]MCM1525975.1 HlyD family efflux transporter periplasmic adaptor subunit [Bacteroides sp.]MCM1562265.1 HlyD family efflux transporter periplasmic adaptor subunit [Clostridium sp.]
MNEKGNKRREWVKTAAIVFLSVLLVLTFFSNTIMNYSLPEVATQYVESGTITAKIRGNGIVESGDPYSVRLKTTGDTNAKGVYEVESVEVKKGDTVAKGDVLCYLTSEESSALEDARDALNDQLLQYEIAILRGEVSGSVLDHAQSGNTAAIATYQSQVLAKENEIQVLKDELKEAEDTLAAWKEQQTRPVDTTEQKAKLDAAQKAYDDVAKVVNAAKTEIAAWEQEKAANDKIIQDYLDGKQVVASGGSGTSGGQTQSSAPAGNDTQTQDASAADPSGAADGTDASQGTDAAQPSAEAGESAGAESAQTEQHTGGLTENAVSEAEYQVALANNSILENRIASKKAEIAPQEAQLPALQTALDQAQKDYDNATPGATQNAADQVATWTKEVANRQQKVTDAEEAKAKLVTDIVTELNWSDTLDDLKEKISELQGESVAGQVTAPIAGTIISVNVKSGQETPTDNILFTIQPEGKGYTMQFSVTNDQAKRLSVGDVAELVNSWRYDDVDVVLSSIRPDPQNPSQNKQLTFDVTGSSVTEGQTLSVSVGQRNATFDYTVPNSAIREDNNGKFILIVETKSTPLSNRYIASRVDVEVLASDDTRSAISGALNGYEYVITTSTAPVEAGKQVRLANN